MPDRADPGRVLVIGVDGVRADALTRPRAPVIRGLASAGLYSAFAFAADADPLSGPAWTTVATGTTTTDHLVAGNDLSPRARDAWPDFLSRLHSLDPHIRTLAAATWAPLVRPCQGGPLFPTATATVCVDPASAPNAADAADAADERITREVCRLLAAHTFHATFVHLGAPDIVGHEVGTGSEYLAAVGSADERVGRIIGALRRRPAYPTEEWTVIATTDHGHQDGGGHGSPRPLASEAEATCWIVAAGTNIVPLADGPTHADIHPQVLASLGFPIRREWTLTGRPFATAPSSRGGAGS